MVRGQVVSSKLALLLACIALGACSDRGPETRIVSVMPAFWSVMDPKSPADTRAARFQQSVIAAQPGLYGPVIPLGADFSYEQYVGEQLAPLLPTMREVDARMRPQIDAGLVQLRERVGDVGGLTIYIAPSLFSSNGQVRVVDDRPVVMFGVDVQAYAELELLPAASRYDMRAYIAHELLHAFHYGVNPEMRHAATTLFDEKSPAPLYLNLWIEGLATCVSMSMDGDGSVERALMSDRLPAELPPVLPALARELVVKLDSRSLVDTRDLFWLGGERSDIPPRSAYGIGALVAEDVLARRGLAAAMRLSGAELRREVGTALARLAQRPAAVDWSAACHSIES